MVFHTQHNQSPVCVPKIWITMWFYGAFTFFFFFYSFLLFSLWNYNKYVRCLLIQCTIVTFLFFLFFREHTYIHTKAILFSSIFYEMCRFFLCCYYVWWKVNINGKLPIMSNRFSGKFFVNSIWNICAFHKVISSTPGGLIVIFIDQKQIWTTNKRFAFQWKSFKVILSSLNLSSVEV